MNSWHKYPFVRILTSFLAGILLADQWHAYTNGFQLQLMGLLLLLIAGVIYYHFYIRYSNRLMYGIMATVALVFVGYLWQGAYNSFQAKNHFSTVEYTSHSFVATLEEAPVEKENSFKAILKVEYLVLDDSTAKPAKGKVLAYFEKRPSISMLTTGDRIVFSSPVYPLEKVRNPNAFDYAGYLENKGIFHRTYIPNDAFEILESSDRGIYNLAQKMRQGIVSALKSTDVTPEAFSLISALVLGADQYLESDMRSWYSNAGVMHILCVSGLHVGILYVVLMFLLDLLPFKSRSYKVIKVLLVVLFIWAYALITGLEPAVMRASVMFSMVAAGKLLQRKTRIYNTLSASAFIMLLVNPNMISWVGFQMSYLAVFGIVWLQPHIRNWWNPNNKLLSYFWELMAVSLAAQLVLFPLLIFYFHKVSVVFFITNLFAIPLATLLIYSTLLFAVTYWWEPLSDLIVLLLNAEAGALNFLTRKISSLPGAFFDDIWIQNWHLVLIYAALFLVLTLLIFSRKYLLPALLVATMVLFVVLAGVEIKKCQNNSFVLYHLNNGMAMDFVTGDSSLFLADSMILNDKKTLDFHIGNMWNALYVTPKSVSFEELNHYTNAYVTCQKPFFLYNNDIFFLLEEMPNIKPKRKITVDYLVIKGKPWINAEKLLTMFHIRKKVLVSGSTPRWLADKWCEAFSSKHIPVHSTHREGAFVINY